MCMCTCVLLCVFSLNICICIITSIHTSVWLKCVASLRIIVSLWSPFHSHVLFEAFIGKTMDKYRFMLHIIETDTIWLFILFKLGIMLKLNCVQDTNNIVLNTSTDGLLPEY